MNAIDMDRYNHLQATPAFRAWVKANLDALSMAYKITPTDDTLTTWTADVYLAGSNGRPYWVGGDVARGVRTITTTPAQPEWLA